MASVWGLDIGKSALKAVRLRFSNEGLEITAVEHIPYPVDEDEDERQEHVTDALRTFLTKHKLGSDKVVVGLPGLHAFSRFIKLPQVEKSKVGSLVRMEAQQQIPFPIEEVNWDFVRIEREYAPGEEIEVGIFACRRELVDGFLADLHQSGIRPDVVTIAPLADYNFIRHNTAEEQEGATLILDIGAEHTDLVIADGERFWVRPLRIAGKDITKALAERFKVPFSEAEKLKRDASKSQQAKKIFSTMEPVLKDLVGEVHRSVGFFKGQAEDLDIKRMVLLGDGAKLKNVTKFFQEQLKYPVGRVQQLEGEKFSIDPDVDMDALTNHILGLGVAIGLALQGAGQARCAINLAPQQLQIESQLKNKLPLAAAAAACSWLALGLGYYHWTSVAERVKGALGKLSAVASVQNTQNEATNEKDVSALEASASGFTSLGEGRTLVLEFLDRLREVLPTENGKLAEVPNNPSVDLFRQFNTYEERVRAEKLYEGKLFLIEMRIDHRKDETAQNRYRVELKVAKAVPESMRGNTDELREQIRRDFMLKLGPKLKDAPFFVRKEATGEPGKFNYGEIDFGVPVEIYGLRPAMTSERGPKSFRCVFVPLTFEIGVPPPPPPPATPPSE
jgi:type IV pilus assembly protein PilM